MTTGTTISIEQFLDSGYDKEWELVDGELRQRNVGQWQHARLDYLLSCWFGVHEKAWKIVGLIAMDIIILPTSLLRPDVTLVRPGVSPDTLVEPPLLVIEMISPRDTLHGTQRKWEKYREMGIKDVWIIDTPARTGYAWSAGQWVQTRTLEVAGTEIFVDLDALFKDLEKSRQAERQIRHDWALERDKAFNV